MIDLTMIPERPAVFVCVRAAEYEVHIDPGRITVKPFRPYLGVEFWQQGKRLSRQMGQALADQAMATPLPPRQAPRVVRLR